MAWDGEGINVEGPDRPQHYVLFGSSDTSIPPLVSGSHLHTFRILDYIIDVGLNNPTAFHVSFSFGYDANQILRSLPEEALRTIHKTHALKLRRVNGDSYILHYIPHKWFSVTRFDKDYNRFHNAGAKTTVRIYDLFTFFACAFTKAYKNLTGKSAGDIVLSGKKARGDFTLDDMPYVERYWKDEIQKLRELAEVLRERMYSAGLRIAQWYGPGALASYVNRVHGIKKYMTHCPDGVREAARYAYAGGRFERFKLGRTEGPIYSLDINSAYPYAISRLPDLSCGVWSRVDNPKRVAVFGVYRIRLLPRLGGTFLDRPPGPLFHRDKMGNISFPWVVEGWYWSPEVKNIVKYLPRSQYEILEGWEYTGWKDSERPFGWIPEMYELRRKWKAEGNESQIALKLAMNSLYGKMAQRVGWNQQLRTAPMWHQLEWAGWVTSFCRAMLWDAMRQAGFDNVIAVETDGMYLSVPPVDFLGDDYRNPAGSDSKGGEFISSTELGGWEVNVYDEILYVQSGLAWLRKGECVDGCRHSPEERDSKRCAWTEKRRGLDAQSFALDSCRDYLTNLNPREMWPAFSGIAHRFIGMGAALASTTPTHDRLGLWIDHPREISAGNSGKRVHVHTQCAACQAGLTAYERAHDMSIRSLAYLPEHRMSKPHDIPWENGDLGYRWREEKEVNSGLISG